MPQKRILLLYIIKYYLGLGLGEDGEPPLAHHTPGPQHGHQQGQRPQGVAHQALVGVLYAQQDLRQLEKVVFKHAITYC